MSKYDLDKGFEEVALDDGFEEIPLEATPSSPSALQEYASDARDLGLGAAQGITFGLADEIEGGVKAAAAKVAGNKQDLSTLYEEYKKLARKDYEDAAERSPVLTATGEIGGAIGGAFATPVLGAGRLAAAGARKLGAKGISKFLAGLKGGTAGKIAGKGTAMAIESAPLGAVAGAGFSEADVGSKEFSEEVKSGALFGGLAGAALSGAQAGVGALKGVKDSLAKETPFLRRIEKSFELGQGGKNLGKESVSADMFKRVGQDQPNELLDQMLKADGYFGKNVGSAIDKADAAGVTINIGDSLDGSIGELTDYIKKNPSLAFDNTGNKLIDLASINKTEVTPRQLKSIRDQLDGFIDKLDGVSSEISNNSRRIAGNLRTSINNQLQEAIPEYKKAATEFAQFRQMVPETILQYGNPRAEPYLGTMKKGEEKLFSKTKQLLEGMSKGGTASEDAVITSKNLFDNLKSLETKNPEALKQMGFKNADEAIRSVKNSADENALMQEISGVEPRTGITRTGGTALTGFAESGRGFILSGANKAGLVLKKPGDIFKLQDDKLGEIANRMINSESGLSRQTGEALKAALENKSGVSKNAVLFTMMQNPDLRNILKDYEEVE